MRALRRKVASDSSCFGGGSGVRSSKIAAPAVVVNGLRLFVRLLLLVSCCVCVRVVCDCRCGVFRKRPLLLLSYRERRGGGGRGVRAAARRLETRSDKTQHKETGEEKGERGSGDENVSMAKTLERR